MVRASVNLKPTTTTIKFLCSYGGKILPRHPDGKLSYHGGETRILAVEASISFAELLVKLGELCGTSVSLRCQLPSEDLDALVTITSDEDLANLIEEYDRLALPLSSLKIRAFLSLPKSTKKVSPPPSTTSSSTGTTASPKTPSASFFTMDRCIRQIWKPVEFSQCYKKYVEKSPHCALHDQRNHSCTHLICNGNHWQ